MAPRHKQGTKTFKELDYSEQAKSISSHMILLYRMINTHINRAIEDGRNPHQTLLKCLGQIARCVDKLTKITLMFLLFSLTSCKSNRNILNEISGIWDSRTGFETIIDVSLVGDKTIKCGYCIWHVTVKEIDLNNNYVVFNAIHYNNEGIKESNKDETIITIRQIWDIHKSFHLAYFEERGYSEELSYIRKLD